MSLEWTQKSDWLLEAMKIKGGQVKLSNTEAERTVILKNLLSQSNQGY